MLARDDRGKKKTDLPSSVESARFLHAALVTKERAAIQQAQGFWFDVGVEWWWPGGNIEMQSRAEK